MTGRVQNKNSKIGRILHIAREFGPVAGAGGIKDVTWGLCHATANAGIAVEIFLPHYRKVDDYLLHHDLTLNESVAFVVPMDYGPYVHAEHVTVSTCQIAPNLCLSLLKADSFRYLAEAPEKKIVRHGIYQYTKAEAAALGNASLEGLGYSDAFAQNVLLVKASLLTLAQVPWRPDLVHCHDGHAALFPLIAQVGMEAYPPYLAHVPTLLTIHNAGKGYHQETAGLDYAQSICGIPKNMAKTVIEACLLEGAFDPLLAGGIYSTAVNTVSENYARELRETGLDALTGWLGHTYAGRGVNLIGITNGIDLCSHNPTGSPDPHLDSFPAGSAGKEALKKAALAQLKDFRDTELDQKYGDLSEEVCRPLFTFVGRLTAQKGFDDLHDAVSRLLDEDEQAGLWGLGNGDPRIVKKFQALAKKYKDRVCFIEGFSEFHANQIFASGDFFLIPSEFEPCGLTDFMAQLKGNVPIVHRVGGLVKTIDGKYGFSYLGGADELLTVMRRATQVYRSAGKKQLRSIQRNALNNVLTHFTWDKVFQRKYLPLYEQVVKKAEPVLP